MTKGDKLDLYEPKLGQTVICRPMFWKRNGPCFSDLAETASVSDLF